MSLKITLRDLDDTARLAKLLAELLAAPGPPPAAGADSAALPHALLLQGHLGSGKTTLTRALVESLPGGDTAEACSPSFTLCNSYDTAPPVLHFDLYRLGPGLRDDELDEAVERAAGGELLLIIEWPERIDANSLPAAFIHCRLSGKEARLAELAANTAPGLDLLRRLAARAAEAGLLVDRA